MKLQEVHRILNNMFQKKLVDGRKRHLVFWYDENGDFIDEINHIDIPGVRKWIMTKNNLFATMYELEKKDPHSHFLLYANMPKPSPNEDWLYDQFKLGEEFTTDRLTVIMREIGIQDDTLRQKFKEHELFFNNNARVASFRKYPVETYTHEIIDLTIIAALVKSSTNHIDDIVKRLFIEAVQGEDRSWTEIRKWADENVFWKLVESYYGYMGPDYSITALQTSFLVTYISQMNQALKLPKEWELLFCHKPANVVVFMNQWMNHKEDRKWYNHLADIIGKQLSIDKYALNWEWQEMLQLDTFRNFDERLITFLARQLNQQLTDFETYDEIISERRHFHWYDEYRDEYEALYHANRFFQLLHQFDLFIPEEPASLMFQSYVEKYYQVDTAYRKFYVHYDRIPIKERLYNVRQDVENMYVNHFIQELALKWTTSLEKNGTDWAFSKKIAKQKNFYQDWVRPYVDNEERVFVIISDALRYEIANELLHKLNNERKASTELTALQGTIPSFTALGMATLLPYEELNIKDEGQVIIDGKPASSINQRQTILVNRHSQSLALSFRELIEMNRQDMRQALQGKKVVYIYHNVIDARGDHATTEVEVFQAAEEALADIQQLVNQLVNNVSASNILITADHGFMYQRDGLPTSQKVPRLEEDTLMVTRRFALTKEAPMVKESVLTFSLTNMSEEPLYVTIPKGNSRFAVQGAGANYVHGGTMLQEIVIPVITFKNDRSNSQSNEVKLASVKLTTPTRKITYKEVYLTFVQVQRVEDKIKPLLLNMYFVDENGEKVSNEIKLFADRTQSEVAERAFREKFVFKDITYDPRQTYELVLEDIMTNSIYERYPFTIDIL